MSRDENESTPQAQLPHHQHTQPLPQHEHNYRPVEVRRSSSNTSLTGSSSAAAPKRTAFVQKLYNMLNDPKLSHLIWWSRGDQDGVFALHPCTEFATALTTYFKHGNVSSFVRQLHMYGFHKVFDTYNEEHQANVPAQRGSDDLVWEFRHSTGAFRKGDEASLSLIKRRSATRVVPDDQLHIAEYHPHPHQIPLAPQPQQIQQPQYYYQVPPPQHFVHYQMGSGPAVEYHQQPAPMPVQQIHPQQIPQGAHVVYVQAPQQHMAMQHQPQGHIHHQEQHRQQLQQPQVQSAPVVVPQAAPQAAPQVAPQVVQPQHSTPPPPPPSSAPEHVHNPVPQHQSPHQSAHSSRHASVAIPPEQQTVAAAQEIALQQREIGARAEYMNEMQRSTTGDVLKIGEHLPKIAPVLKTTGHKYAEPFTQLQHSFNQRAETLTPEPQEQHQIQAPPPGPLQQQQVPQRHAGVPVPHHFAPQKPGAVMVNPFTQSAAQRNQSIHFWERSTARQPSVFVDPLHPHPHPQQHHPAHSPLASGPSSPSQSNVSSQRPSTVSVSAVPPSQFQHPLAHQQHLHHEQPQRNANSVPHIHYDPVPGSPTEPAPRRTDSLPTNFPPPPPPPSSIPPPNRQYAPRSIPEDHQQPHHQIHYSHPPPPGVHHSPQQQPSRSGSSIPNMAHLSTRLRPSLLEFYNNNPMHHAAAQTTSMSSNSTYTSTLYSAQSSISSISSRNSQGSLSGVVHDLQQRQHSHTYPDRTFTPPPTSLRQSIAVADRPSAGTTPSTPTVSKVAVSSLLSSPGSKEEGKKRAKEGDEGRGLKKVKSMTNLN